MQSITSFNLLTLRPTILISHEGLEAIKRIVSLAPQEAQWFHTVEPVEYRQSPGEVFLHLSTKLYIPKQNTSSAQVDSTSSMMVEFYNELKEEYVDQGIVNQKLSTMTCWCHSHVNMNPSPSNQDDLQFNRFVNSATDQNQSSWQIMLIFNKKDQFYSRVYDPTSKTIIEGVPIELFTDYDFDYIATAAKNKFISPKKPINLLGTRIPLTTFTPSSRTTQSSLTVDENVDLDLAEDITFELYPTEDIFHSAKITAKSRFKKFYSTLTDYFDLKELEIFYFLFIRDKKGLLNTRHNLSFNESQIKKHISDCLSTTSASVQDVTHFLALTLQLEVTHDLEEFKFIVEDAFNV